MYSQEYINRLAVNTTVSALFFKVMFVCSISIHLKIREILTQRFRNASTRIRRAFTPPPHRGNVLSEARDASDSGIQNEDRLFIQSVSGNQSLSATRRWSFMQLMVYLNQIVMKMINKSKQVAVVLVNLIKVKIHIVQNAYINQRRSQEREGRSQSHHNQRRRRGMLRSFLLFCSVCYSLFLLS